MTDATRLGQEVSNLIYIYVKYILYVSKVIIEKSRGKGSLMEQDTIENVS